MNFNRNCTMINKGPIVVIEDDHEDQLLMKLVFENLGYKNDLVFFSDVEEALAFLNGSAVPPFLVLSDINIPKIDGFKLRDMIREQGRFKNNIMPFIFFTTSATQKAITDAFRNSIQGFFLKSDTMEEIENTIRVVMEYWNRCVTPVK